MGSELLLLLPEIVIVGIVAALALLEMFLPEVGRRFAVRLNLVGMLFVALLLAGLRERSGTAFGGMFALDPLAIFFKLIFLGTAAVTILLQRESRAIAGKPEFPLILWSALLGMFFLVSSKNFLLFFISLELMTLSLYILAAFAKSDLLSIEAGLKYLVLGSLASALLVYGVSLIYAATGTLDFLELGEFVAREVEVRHAVPLLFQAGSLLVLSALAFKVASVPFQVWVPDVYEGAPTPVVAFFSVASKSAGFAALTRVLFEVLGPLEAERRLLFSLFAALTILYGSLGALAQKNMKRLLGYSSIGHAGFLLMALASGGASGRHALLYYLAAYAVTNLAAFLVVSVAENHGGSEIASLRGLSQRSPLLAAGIFVALLSLAGVPPLAGFTAKFFVLLAAARSGFAWLVFLGAVSIAISLYYYLSVVRVVYFEKAETRAAIALSFPTRVLLYGLMAAILAIGLWPVK